MPAPEPRPPRPARKRTQRPEPSGSVPSPRTRRPRPGSLRRPTPQPVRRSAAQQPRYFAHVTPGLEEIASEELRRAGASPVETLAHFDRRDSIVVFTAGDLAAVMRCGTLEDVFQIVLDVPTPPGRPAPHVLARGLDRALIERALVTHNSLSSRKSGRTYRVVARIAGRHLFRREDLEKALSATLDGLLAKWVPAREHAALELWVQVMGERTLLAVRLSGDELAQRRYKKAHLPASLKPTVARGLVLMAGLQPGQTVVDPMCGTGTVLREAADSTRALVLVGGDNDAEALAAARTNAGKQAHLVRWDAARLPLPDDRADALITNPPYGRQHGAVPGLGRLYRQFLRESARVLRPGGRCVVLTGEPRELAEALPKTLRIQARRRLLLRGLPVTAFVIVRA